MSEIVLLGAAVLGAAWGAVLVHEGCHYVAGRWLGVPVRSIRIQLERPPHVALREGEEWLSPDHPEYAVAFAHHNPSATAAWLFVAAGFLGETVVALALAAVFFTVGTVSWVVVGASTAVLVLYLVSDVVLAAGRGRPYGDFTSLWRMAPAATVVAVAVALLLRAGALLLLV